MTRRAIHKNELFRVRCGLTPEKAAELCDVSLSHIYRWDHGYKDIPVSKRKLMQLYSCFDLSHLGKEWQGCYIANGVLYSPMGFDWTPVTLDCMGIEHRSTIDSSTLERKARFASLYGRRRKSRYS